jgi:chemotaxis protein CheD
MDNELLKVGIADMAVTKTAEGIITYALGSCIGICLYDPSTKIVGMVHIMLPKPSNNMPADNIAKYADTGIPELIKRMEQTGAAKARLVAKIAGGAKMFNMLGSGGSMIGDIGSRNTEMVKSILTAQRIRLLGEDCGADYARTMSISRESGEVCIKTYGKGEKIL